MTTKQPVRTTKIDRAREMLAIPATFPPAPPDSDLRTVPGHAGLPVIGEMLELLGDQPAWTQRRFDRFGPVSWGCILGQRVVVALGPDAAETILLNRSKDFANGPAWEYIIGPFFRRGMLLLDFDEHLHHRRIMQQAFTNPRLRGYLATMNPAITRGLDGWTPADDFQMLPAIKHLTLDVAADIFLDVELGADTDEINEAFTDMVRAGMSYVRFPVPGGRWSKGMSGRRKMERFFAKRIADKRSNGGDDLFAALCQAQTDEGDRFTDADVLNHMIFLLMAAHDTTTITMNSMVYQLAKHPQWQDRVRCESRALGKDTIDYDDLDTLVGLDLVMKEALRLIPPISGYPRRTVVDTEILGHFIPANTTVINFPAFTHSLDEYWPEPTRFDPERFAENRREDKVHKFAWEPFGGGVHKCIGMHFAGMQIKAVLHQMLLRYRISVDPNYEVQWDYSTLPVPKDGLPVRLDRI